MKTPKEKPHFFEDDDPRDELSQDENVLTQKQIDELELIKKLKKIDKELSEEGVPKYAPGSPDEFALTQKQIEDLEKQDSSSDEEPGDELPDEIVSEKDIDFYTISQHRKAFVKWVNQYLYKKVKDLNKDSPLRIYQLLVQKYLAIDTLIEDYLFIMD